MYYAELKTKTKNKRRRRIIWIFVLLLIVAIVFTVTAVLNSLKSNTTITKSKAVVTAVNYNTKTKQYNEGLFTISLPVTWQPIPRPLGEYTSFTWETSSGGANGEQIEIYQDTIPVNYAANRALIVQGETDRISIVGSISDNCANFTEGLSPATPGQIGVLAKWQGVSFLCDQNNTERDSIGTSSTDGINTVILQSQTDGSKHKFFFTYTDDELSPDYTTFENAINSFRMQ